MNDGAATIPSPKQVLHSRTGLGVVEESPNAPIKYDAASSYDVVSFANVYPGFVQATLLLYL
ncbi:MAG: hypothetical protein SAK29_19530 [Scytonema sp. PMC 1069.18]|nr:hypothetical protein [Scytonema sp. PMC 1069.18]